MTALRSQFIKAARQGKTLLLTDLAATLDTNAIAELGRREVAWGKGLLPVLLADSPDNTDPPTWVMELAATLGLGGNVADLRAAVWRAWPPCKTVSVGPLALANDRPLVLIAGPCVLESRAHALEMSAALAQLAKRYGVGLIYKTSFDKANRTSANSARGVGLNESIDILAEVKQTTGLPIVTDVHLPDQCAPIAQVVDVLQIPAFLCRQTDLLVAAAKTGLPVKVKKGQFLAPWDMPPVLEKLTQAGCKQVIVTERGTSFGYNTLVCDMRGIPCLAANGWPVVFDATHAVQQPGGQGTTTGGQREYVPVLARAATALGIAGLFVETHQDPDHAPSDGPNMVPLAALPGLIESVLAQDKLAKSDPL